MKTLLRFTLYTTIIYLTISTLNPALAAVNLNVGEPRTVRLIYYLPNDRPYRAEVVQQMKTDILLVQNFFAEEMRWRGHGNITFRVETDPQGEPMVHRVDGGHPDSRYVGDNNIDTLVADEIRQRLDWAANVYVVLLDNSHGVKPYGSDAGKNGGLVMVENDSHWLILAHELGHAFGLHHDFRNNNYIMSYGGLGSWSQLSACSAEYLSVHPYFNPNAHPEDTRPTIELISPQIYPAGAKNVSIKLKVSDAEGLHQVILSVTTLPSSFAAVGFQEVKAWQGLEGETDTIVEFSYDGVIPSSLYLSNLSIPTRHPIRIEAIDVNGNRSSYSFNLESDSPESILLDNASPYWGIELADHEGKSVASILSERPNLGQLGVGFTHSAIRDLVEIVSAVSTGRPHLKRLDLDGNLISDLSPMVNLTDLISLNLRNNNISDISPLLGLTDLTYLNLRNNNISDISPLLGLTDLTYLNLGDNNISDISALSGLTDLTYLDLNGSNISDISALSGLTALTELHLYANNISDISAVSGLTDLTTLWLGDNTISDISALAGLNHLEKLFLYDNTISDLSVLTGLHRLKVLYVKRNPLSYTSINTHIPTLQARGVQADFDERTLAGLVKRSNDQHIAPAASVPIIVEAQASNGGGFEGVPVTFTLTAGSGTLSTTATTTDKRGQAESTLTLGTDLGTRIVEVSVPEIEQPVTFTIVGRQGVIIPDPNLRAKIGEALGKASADRISPSEIATLTDLYARHADISNLTGLEHATNLTYLNLHDNNISDISPLSDLTNLTYLNLHQNNISDLSAVSGLTDLTTLNLGNNNISDISAVSGLIALTTLDLYRNNISDISAVSGLTALTTLNLYGSNISDISAVSGLTDLTTLNLGNNNISDISAVSGLTALTTLNLYGSNISDISAVSGLTDLTTLNLGNNNISNISAVSGLTALTWLSLFGNNVSDISAVSGLTDLTTLSLYDNNISDLSAVSGLTALTTLNLYGNNISDLSAVSGLTALTWLNLYGNNISDLSAVSGLTDLTYLNLFANNNISDLSPLVANKGLKSGAWVDVRGNRLGYTSINTHIPTLQGRGITVNFDSEYAYPALLKISGDNQKGTAAAVLANPFVVEVQDSHGTGLAGISVTFAVTAGHGILSAIHTTTDANGRAESTLTLGPNLGTNTVSASVNQSIQFPHPSGGGRVVVFAAQWQVTFNVSADTLPTEFLLSIPAGISLIHVPLKVTAVDGVEKTITSIADLYDALGGVDTVNLLGTHDSKTRRWFSYIGTSDRGTSGDQPLTDDTGVIASMKNPVTVRLRGDPLGANRSSAITLYPGINIVGVPLRDSRIARVTDLFALNGIRDNVIAITVSAKGEFHTVRQVSDAGDIRITGGQSFNLKAQEAATVAISGDGWYNASGTAASPPMPLTGIQVTDTTPVLELRGSIIGEEMNLNSGAIRVIVENLSNNTVVTGITSEDEGIRYQASIVDVETGRAAKIGDRIQISVRSSDLLIGVQPPWYTITAEDVRRNWIQLPTSVAYEIPAKTELLANYPNPFNPETWIPYRLAEDAFVTLTIYDTAGQVVRTLKVGHRIASAYENRSKAIYWDGRNDVGERVASGVYFYTLTAGDYSATRRMVILK